MRSIDVVIPSYRLQSEYLIAMIRMEMPAETQVRFLIIADNPQLPVPEDLLPFIDGEKVILIRNKINAGASKSRNIGIDHSAAEWILFLDDDVKPHEGLLKAYCRAIDRAPEEVGFFGATVFPQPVNSFTHGLVAGGMLYFFEFAGHNDEARCATTSNILVKRSAIGNIRFRETFPKKGGGEDFAFFLEIYDNTGRTLKSVRDAPVYHGWWHKGRRNYTQFIRWSFGDFELFRMFPHVTYYDFPNVVEMLLIGTILGLAGLIVWQSFIPLVCIITGIITGEILAELAHLLRTKGRYGGRYVLEVVLVRGAADLGRFYGSLVNSYLKDFLKRPNYSNYEVNIYFRLWSGLKFMSYIVISALLMALVYTL